MLPFSASTLARMREVQEAHMQDTCHILTYDTTWEETDEYGIPIDDYLAEVASICGLKLYSPKEIHASGEVPTILGELRLPIDTVIDTRSRVRIVERFGEALVEPMLFDVGGPARRGPSGLVVFLRAVDEEAAGMHNERREGE